LAQFWREEEFTAANCSMQNPININAQVNRGQKHCPDQNPTDAKTLPVLPKDT